MAARSVYKLFAKTCSGTLNTQTPSAVHCATKDSNNIKKKQRSLSYSPIRHHRTKEYFWLLRNVSKSSKHFRDEQEYEEYDDYEAPYETERLKVNTNVFPSPKDVSLRDLAKEFKPPPVEETKEDENPVYELGETARSEENLINILDHMKQVEYHKMKYLFLHLQPSNIKPYGSFENIHQANKRKPIKIVYPVVHSRIDSIKKRKVDDTQRKEFSSCSRQNEYSAVEKVRTTPIVEPNTKVHSNMNYSTNLLKRKPSENFKRVTKPMSTSFTRLSNTALLKNKKNQKLPTINNITME